jgi:hypothetical protein
MPTHLRDDDIPVVHFDIRTELSPFLLFRHLRDDRPVLLWDVRKETGGRTLKGATPYPGDDSPLPEDHLVVLFDDDGSLAVAAVERRQNQGDERCKALFGGLDLYAFALDPEVVGEETFLISA